MTRAAAGLWEGVLSTTVVTDTAARADALATAFFVMGYDEAARYCEQDDSVSAIFVLPQAKGEPQVKLIGDLLFRPSQEYPVDH